MSIKAFELRAWPVVPCCVGAEALCVCSPAERAIRGWAEKVNLRGVEMPPMTAEQREFILSEIGSVEGHSRSEHVDDSDRDLAAACLEAWLDECSDYGPF